MNIGFIGLGHMGQPMVANLLAAGHVVKVYDLNPKALAQVQTQGAIPVASPVQTAIDADAVVTMLQTGEQVWSCCQGQSGLFHQLSLDAIYIDCSSIDIRMTQKLHAQAQALGLSMVDAPVSGGVKGAENATLTIMVGGQETAYIKAKPLLEQLGARVVHAGAAGNGQAAKICNNMMLGISMIAVSEGFTLGEKLGLDPKVLFEIASHSSSQCWSMTSYCPVPNILDNVPANHDYQPGFSSAMMQKDLKLSQAAAQTVAANTPLGTLATQLYETFSAQHPELDFSAIIQMLR